MKVLTYIRFTVFALVIQFIKYTIILSLSMDFYLIEFIDKKYTETQEYILIYILPFAIIFSLIGILRKKYGFIKNSLIVTSTTVLTFGLWMFFGLMTFASGMCGRVNEKTLYVSKANKQITIIECYIDCGATDSGHSTKIYRKMVSYFNTFRLITPINPEHLNMDLWESAKSPKRVKNKITIVKFNLKINSNEPSQRSEGEFKKTFKKNNYE